MLNAGFAYLNMEDKTIHTFGQSTSTGLYADGSSFSLNQLYFQKDTRAHKLTITSSPNYSDRTRLPAW